LSCLTKSNAQLNQEHVGIAGGGVVTDVAIVYFNTAPFDIRGVITSEVLYPNGERGVVQAIFSNELANEKAGTQAIA